jgi:hypothetical protein
MAGQQLLSLRIAARCGVAVILCFAPGATLRAAESGERWLKVTAPEFTVITPLKEKEAVAWAGQFSQFIAALQGFINVDVRRLPRLTMVVFAREKEFSAFRPVQENGTPIEVAGFFSRRTSWAVAGLAGARMSEETRTTIFHEGTHWFLSGFELPNPVWLEEGLAEVFSTFVIEGRKASWGRPIQSHVEALQLLRPIMPLEQLLFLAQDNLHGDSDDASLRTGLAYAQSWAFVHYLIFGQRKVPKGALIEYVKRLRTHHPDQAFRDAFGGTYAEIDRQLTEYLRGGRYFVAHQSILELPAAKAVPATVAEVEDALARLRMAGNRHGEAKANVERVLAASPDDPRSYELQGELAQELGDAEAARAAFRQAAAKGSQDFRTYYEIAYADHAAAGSDDGTRQTLTPERAREVANNYERAINLNPRHRASYQNLAGIIGLLPPGNADDAKFLGVGWRIFPDDGMIRLGIAVVAKREGNHEQARAMLAKVVDEGAAHPSSVLEYARRLETEWMQRDVFAQLDQLVKDRKFGEAVAMVDARIAEGVDFHTRQRLQQSRDSLYGSHLLEQANAAMSERRWDEAREKFNAVLESNASPILKSQVRRYVEQLDKRGVGKKK